MFISSLFTEKAFDHLFGDHTGESDIERKNRIIARKKFFDTKLGLKDKIMSSDFVYFPYCNRVHWHLYIICNPGKILNNLKPENEDKAIILHLDSLEYEGPNQYMKQMFCHILNLYFESEVEETFEVQHLDIVRVQGLALQSDGYNCGLHVGMYILNFERYIEAEDITSATLSSDPGFRQTIANQSCFRYDTELDARQLRHECVTFFIRLVQIFSKLECFKKHQNYQSTFLDQYSQPCAKDCNDEKKVLIKFAQKVNSTIRTMIKPINKCSSTRYDKSKDKPQEMFSEDTIPQNKTKLDQRRYTRTEHLCMVTLLGKNGYAQDTNLMFNVGFCTLIVLLCLSVFLKD